MTPGRPNRPRRKRKAPREARLTHPRNATCCSQHEAVALSPRNPCSPRVMDSFTPSASLLRYLIAVAVGELEAREDRRGREEALYRMLQPAVEQTLLLGKG